MAKKKEVYHVKPLNERKRNIISSLLEVQHSQVNGHTL